MKKFFSFLAAAAMLFTASCSNDDLGENEGGDALVSFSMNLDGVSSTKADVIGKGTLVDQLQYAVFEITKNDAGEVTYQKFLHKYNTMNDVQWPAQVDIRLAKNKSYRVVFWAQDASCNAYEVTTSDAGMNVTVDYAGINNDETRDAFFGYADLENVSGSIKQDVTLKRPFAQLNVGVTNEDWQGALNSGVVMTHSTVTVKQVANTINLFNGEIGANNTDVTYTMAQRPDQDLYVDINNDGTKESFHYLSMSYLLVEQNNVSADFTFSTAAAGGHEIELNIPTVPVTRNHRTNILGQILTGNITFQVYIDAEFDGEHLEGALKIVKNREELQAALDAAQAGYAENIIVFGADITGDVVIPQTQGTNIIVDGAQFKYDGKMTIRGNNRSEGKETLVIKNVNFETTTTKDFIWADSQSSPDRYAHNVTIENCTFTAKDAAINNAVGFRVRQAYNIAMKGCTATNMHSMIQAQSIGTTDVIIDGATINGGKNGLSLKVKNAIVTNANINVTGYGVRFSGNYAEYASLNVKDCNITAFQPVVVRNMTAANNTFNFEGNNTLTPTTDPYQIVITKGDDEETYSVPAVEYTLNGAEDFIVYPINVRDVATADDFKAAASNEIVKIININADLNFGTSTAIVTTNKVINGNGFKFNAGGTTASKNYGLGVSGANVVINDIVMNGGGGIYSVNGANVVVNNVTLKTNYSASGRHMFYVSDAKLTVNSGTYEVGRTGCKYFSMENNGQAIVLGGTFEDMMAKDAPVTLQTGATLTVMGGKFQVATANYKFDPTAFLAPGYKAERVGDYMEVSAE